MTQSRLPARLEPDRLRFVGRRVLLLAPVVLGVLGIIALIQVASSIFTSEARAALTAAIIGGLLTLLTNLVAQYVSAVVAQLRDEDARYRREIALMVPLLMEMTEAALAFRHNAEHEDFHQASTGVWDVAKMGLGEFWHPAKLLEVGAAYASIRLTNELIVRAGELGRYPDELRKVLITRAKEIEAARAKAGEEPIRWNEPKTKA